MRKLAVALVALTLAASPSARADDDGGAGSPGSASMTCERVAAPGRVRCEVEARVTDGDSIAWGDVVLTRVPDFATALRGRVGPHEATAREATRWRWALALVARERGTGAIEGRVRLVVCRGGACAQRELEASAQVVAGATATATAPN